MTISRLLRFRTSALCLLFLVFLLSMPAMAQPFGGWIVFQGYPDHSYISIPHNSGLNFNGTGFTFEAWVSMNETPAGPCCRSIAGKNYANNWWVGVDLSTGEQVLRSYLAGVFMDAGIIPPSTWTHIAVVYTGTRRIHYINGEKVGERIEALSGVVGYADMRFGSDYSWPSTPKASLNEMRLWNIPRTEAQIRAYLNQQIVSPMPGLLGVWSMSGTNVLGYYNGTIVGTGAYGWTFPVTTLGCNGSSDPTGLCLHNRFWATIQWRTNPTPGTPPDGWGRRAGCANAGAGIFYFFDPAVWEAMVKIVNGCGVNNKWWVFSAATTDVFYRMTIMDTLGGSQKVYFNYRGAAQAVIDVNAFTGCP